MKLEKDLSTLNHNLVLNSFPFELPHVQSWLKSKSRTETLLRNQIMKVVMLTLFYHFTYDFNHDRSHTYVRFSDGDNSNS